MIPTYYVNPQVSLIITLLLMVNLLLVGLAWYNLKEIRKSIKTFLQGEQAERIAAALEKDQVAEAVRVEYLGHTHGADGRVVS
jgi:hypothetical protein